MCLKRWIGVGDSHSQGKDLPHRGGCVGSGHSLPMCVCAQVWACVPAGVKVKSWPWKDRKSQVVCLCTSKKGILALSPSALWSLH